MKKYLGALVLLLFIPIANAADVSDSLRKQELEANRKKLRDPEYIDKVGQDIEAVFLNQVLKDIYADVPVDPMFGGSHAEEMYRQLLLEQISKEMPKKNGIGIAKKISGDLKRRIKANDEYSKSNTTKKPE